MVIMNDTYRSPNRMIEEKKRKKGEPRPVSTVGGGRGGSLLAFAMGHGGPDS